MIISSMYDILQLRSQVQRPQRLEISHHGTEAAVAALRDVKRRRPAPPVRPAVQVGPVRDQRLHRLPAPGRCAAVQALPHPAPSRASTAGGIPAPLRAGSSSSALLTASTSPSAAALCILDSEVRFFGAGRTPACASPRGVEVLPVHLLGRLVNDARRQRVSCTSHGQSSSVPSCAMLTIAYATNGSRST